MTRNFVLTVCITVCLAFGASLANAQEGRFFTNNAYGNPVAYSPGVHKDDVTYISYQGPLEDPWVASYNHETDSWAGPYKAGVSLLGKDPNIKIDNHGRPSLVVDSAGYIHVFYGGHGGDTTLHGENPLGNTHSGELRHRVSRNPYDISSWRTLDNISNFGTYTQAVTMGNGDIYLFYRHGAHQSDWVYQRSTDNGITFAKPVSVIKSEKVANITDNTRIHAWYLSVTKFSDNRLGLAFNYHAENRPHDLERRDGHYVYMDTDSRKFFNIKNEEVTLPIRKGKADRQALVVRTDADKWAVGPKVVIDRKGWPHFVLREGSDDDSVSKTGGPKKVRYYRWDGNTEKWSDNSDTSLPVGTAQIVVHDPRDADLLIALREKNDAGVTEGKIIRWTTNNGGKTFTKGSTVFNGRSGGMDISDRITDAHPDAQFIFVDRKTGEHSDYSDLILWGDSGPVKRLRTDARVR
jgi:hypothetical protein